VPFAEVKLSQKVGWYNMPLFCWAIAERLETNITVIDITCCDGIKLGRRLEAKDHTALLGPQVDEMVRESPVSSRILLKYCRDKLEI